MSSDKLVRLPATFCDDHADRDLDTPKVEKRTKGHVWIRLSDPNLHELLNDAAHYAHQDGPDLISSGLKASARATVSAVTKAREVAS